MREGTCSNPLFFDVRASSGAGTRCAFPRPMKRSWNGFLACALLASASVGCLSRPVGTDAPTTKVSFSSTVSQQQIDKVDLLFMIDNSASMADKQAILARAVPNLLLGLVQPKCIDPATGKPDASGKTTVPTGGLRDNFGCPAGTEPEFRPVTDIHIAVISSSLGGLGGDICNDAGRENDRAHLLDHDGVRPIAGAQPSGFLSWYPQNEENEDKKRHPQPAGKAFGDTAELSAAFAELVSGVGQSGCGVEAQMESWYRFLVQPDPWRGVRVDAAGQASLGAPGDIDFDLLKQRADFLRPDSLVAVILLTDEDDASVDPLALNGRGWKFMTKSFTPKTGAPRATSACGIDPGSPDCTSCGFECDPTQPACQKIKNDPECLKNGGYYLPEEDVTNARFGHQLVKRNYGVDFQYPVSRYTDALTKSRVPDRRAEHPETAAAGGRSIASYEGKAKCTNPLFASKLPRSQGDETCNLPRGSRSPDQVFFAVVGGVPNDLLHFDPTDADKRRITSEDWGKILGRDPARYDYAGIDPHMIQSKTARPGLPAASDVPGDNGPDPVHGREWDTKGTDLQYACTFELETPRDCADGAESCDCGGAVSPPLCAATAGRQVRAKAYPTVRELMAVRALGEQGVVASLCPITLKGDPQDPRYGYNPAVRSILDRLAGALTTQCLPQKLTRDSASNEVPCLVLAQLGDDTDSCENQGLEQPEPAILERFLEQRRAESKAGGPDLSTRPVCRLPQLVAPRAATCKDSPEMGWCYVENADGASPAGRCPQALVFSSGTGALAGARFDLVCIQQLSEGASK